MRDEQKQNLIGEIRKELYRLQDREYGEFQKKLIPTVRPETVIGVRTPDLRKYAKSLVKREEVTEFLRDLPHRYFDENQLHAFILAEMKDFEDNYMSKNAQYKLKPVSVRCAHSFLSSTTGQPATSSHQKFSKNTVRSCSGISENGYPLTNSTRSASE